MAIIYSYPTVAPTVDDLVLGTDVNQTDKPTKNFTVQSLVDLVAGGVTGLGATIESNPSAKNAAGVNQSAIDFTDITGNGTLSFPGLISTTITNAGAITTASLTATGAISGLTLSGILTAGSSIAGLAGGTDGQNVLGVTQNVGDNSTRLATTAYVDSIVDPSILQYLGDATGPFDLSLVSDDFKIAGTANQIETTAATVTGNVGIVTLKFPTAGITLPDGSIATTQAAADDSTKVATTAFVRDYDDLQDLDFTDGTTASTVLLNSQTLTLEGTALQVTTAVTAQKVKFSLPANVTIGGIFTGTTFAGDLLGTVNTATIGTTQAANNDSTLIATTKYVDNAAGAKILQYQGDTGGPFDLNLKDDDLDIAGGSNISTTAATVATNLGVITIDLNDSVTITGTMKADTFTTTAGTATWVTTVLDGFTSITSTSFVGALTGNASTASALLTTGTINMTSTAGATLGPTATAVTYTSGGNISLVSVLAASTVTSKLLTGISFSTGTNVAATDTILEGVGKLQKQITDLPAGLDYISTWDARTVAEGGVSDGGDPDLRTAGLQVPGHYYIVATAGSATPNGAATTPSEWKIGDWCIRGDADNDVWQKIDNTSEVTTDGSGVAGTMPVWNNASELGSSQIQQIGVAGRTVTTIVDGGAGGDLTVQGNTLLGSASTDTVNSVGVHTIDEQLILKKGLGVGATPDYGDTTDKVLTSGNGSANPPTWTNRSTWGYVDNVALTHYGDAFVVTVTDGGGPDVGLAIAAKAGASATDYINGIGNITAFPVLDNYVDWKLQGDSGTNQDITKQTIVDFAGGTKISTATTTDTLTITHAAQGNTPLTDTALPAFGATFTAISAVAVDSTGHLTGQTVKTVTIPSLPTLDNYQYWTLSDGTTTVNISSTNTAEILGGTGITSSVSATDKSVTLNFDGTFPAAHGTQYSLPLWNTATTLDDSQISQNSVATEIIAAQSFKVTGKHLSVGGGTTKGLTVGGGGPSKAGFNFGTSSPSTNQDFVAQQGIHYSGRLQANSTAKVMATVADGTGSNDIFGITARVYITSGYTGNATDATVKTARIYDVACLSGEAPVFNKVIDSGYVGTGTLAVSFAAYSDLGATPKRGFTMSFTTNSGTNSQFYITIEMLSARRATVVYPAS